MIAALLDQRLREVGIPITGVSIGKAGDKSTWQVHLAVDASEQHGAQAQAIVAAFTLPSEDDEKAEQARSKVDMRIIHVLTIELLNAIPDHPGKPTFAQLRARMIARYKSLA